jgi:hypothetical protein
MLRRIYKWTPPMRLIPARAETDAPAKQGSISFLKKRNKKLLFFWSARPMQAAFP